MMDNQSIEILLVEDNPNDVELELRAFKKNNLANKVFVVRDGAEALDYLFGTGPYTNRQGYVRPKVILLDLKLPKISGMDVLRKVRADERTKTIPVVILTSSKEERDLVESYKLGVNSYITKPIEFDTFVGVSAELGLYWLSLNKLPVA
jgi:two-component system, response regulator